MRVRHDWLRQLLLAPSGPPMSGELRLACEMQLGAYGLLLLQADAAHARGQLIGGLWLSVAVILMCVLCVSVAWRSRPSFAQLMMPVGALHLLLAVLHALPMTNSRSRNRFGWLGLPVPAALHLLLLVLAARALRAAAATGAAAAKKAANRRAPPAPFMRSMSNVQRAPALVLPADNDQKSE
jgi:hypothetical protein